MPRPAATPQSRMAKIVSASDALPAARAEALSVTAAKGAESAEAREAWAVVEELGATVHRQARILAGKSRGG